MGDVPQELLARLFADPVPRADISASLGTKGSVSMMLSEQARLMQPPHLVERHIDGTEISYSLRPTAAGEVAGQVKAAQGQ